MIHKQIPRAEHGHALITVHSRRVFFNLKFEVPTGKHK